MAIVLNLLALVLVVGISWFAMVWLSTRVHRGLGVDDEADESSLGLSEHPCRTCKGVGAQQRLGRLEPCPVCEGTGVETASF